MIAKRNRNLKGEGMQNTIFGVLLLVFLFGTVIFLFVSNWRITQKRSETIEKIKSLQEEVRILEEKNEKLKQGLVDVEDEAYWEEKMREQGYKKPGEEAVVVLPAENKTEESANIEKSFWDRFKEKFGL